MKVNIYLETDKQCQACIQRKYGYVIEIMYLPLSNPGKDQESHGYDSEESVSAADGCSSDTFFLLP